jgi:hypothetical protein
MLTAAFVHVIVFKSTETTDRQIILGDSHERYTKKIFSGRSGVGGGIVRIARNFTRRRA